MYNTRVRLKKIRVREYLHENMCATWKRVGHIKVTAIHAEITDASLHPRTGANLHDLC